MSAYPPPNPSRPRVAASESRIKAQAVSLPVPVANSRERHLEGLFDRLPHPIRRRIRWLRQPSSRWLRLPAGIFFVLGGLLSILPVFGLWMLPVGLVLLAEDVPWLRRRRDRLIDGVARHRPHWLEPRQRDHQNRLGGS
jgi:hypothetical protein